jgi:hypothetical protein
MKPKMVNITLTLLFVLILALLPASANSANNEPPLGPLPIPRDIINIHPNNEYFVIQYIYNETMARGGAEANYILISVAAYEYEMLVESLQKMGFSVWLGERYKPSLAPVIAYESGGEGEIDEDEFVAFESRMKDLLDGISTPGLGARTPDEAVAQAKAYRARIIAEVDEWLDDYRQKISEIPSVRSLPMDIYHDDDLEGVLERAKSRPDQLSHAQLGYEGAYKLNVEITLPDFRSEQEYLANMLSRIKNAQTAEEAWDAANRFYTEASRLRIEWSSRSAEIKTSINNAFTEWAMQFQDNLKADLELYGEYQGHIARYRLLVQAKAEALRAQAEILSRISQEIYEMHMAQYGGQKLTPQQIERIMMEGFRIGMSRGAVEGMQAQREMEAKYRQAAEDERARITALVEEQAAIGEQRAMLLLNHIGNRFASMGETIRGATQSAEYERYLQSYQDEAEFYRTRITVNVLDHYIKDAEQIIASNRAEIDLAYREGRIDTNTDQLLAKLRSDREAMLAELLAAGDDQAAIARVEANYRAVWQNVQKDFAKVRFEGVQEILTKMAEQIPPGLSQTISDGIRECRTGIARLEDMARNQWKEYRDFKGESRTKGLFYECWVAYFTPLHDQCFERLKTSADEYTAQLEVLLDILARYEAIKNKPDDYAVQEMLALKDELIREYSLLQRYESHYQWASRNYDAARQQAYEYCLQETRGK